MFPKGGVTALENIDLAVAPGEFVSLIGPSGCGKSTLLRVIGDLTPPTSGEVHVNGKPAPRARLDRDYGIVFQAAVLYDWRTVAKNIALPLELMKWDRARRDARVTEMLELVELGDFGSHYPGSSRAVCSNGSRSPVRLSFSPALLLMDEPFGALDEMTRERLNLELLQIWAETGSTVIFVTHSISEAVFLSTRVVVMSPRPGRIAGVVEIDLPQPRGVRTREEPHFFESGDGSAGDAPRRRDGVGAVSSVAASQPRDGAGRASVAARTWFPAVLVFALGLLCWQWILPDVLGVKSLPPAAALGRAAGALGEP